MDESKRIFPYCEYFFDVFSGTGVVAVEALAKGYMVSANDLEKYSFCILQSLLNTPRTGIDNLIDQLSGLRNESKLLNSGRHFMKELLEQEKNYFDLASKQDFPWEEYNEFIEKTAIVDGTASKIDQLRQKGKWNLFSHYYANTYFGIKQCLQLDALRELAEKQKESKRIHLLAATISAMTFGVSSTTHLAQYLHPSSGLTALHLIRRRQFDFISEVEQRLTKLKQFELPMTLANIYNLDYVLALQQENLNDNWTVYADPPYFKEHYSRYYHVLNTFYLYDYPYLTFNPMTKQVTRGRYRSSRNVSDFGKKAYVKKAFSKLFDLCRQRKFKLIVSYADTSLVKKHLILELAKEAGLRSVLSETTLMHSSQGKYNNKVVTEYLFCFEPQGH